MNKIKKELVINNKSLLPAIHYAPYGEWGSQKVNCNRFYVTDVKHTGDRNKVTCKFCLRLFNSSFGFANAICLSCGSTKENLQNAFCINGHDNWLELNDEAERFQIALERFRVPLNEIILSIKQGIDLLIVLE